MMPAPNILGDTDPEKQGYFRHLFEYRKQNTMAEPWSEINTHKYWQKQSGSSAPASTTAVTDEPVPVKKKKDPEYRIKKLLVIVPKQGLVEREPFSVEGEAEIIGSAIKSPRVLLDAVTEFQGTQDVIKKGVQAFIDGNNKFKATFPALYYHDDFLRDTAKPADAAFILTITANGTTAEQEFKSAPTRLPAKSSSQAGQSTSPAPFVSAAEGKKIAACAKAWAGTPYVKGGKAKTGADCSGSVWGIYNDAGFVYEYSASATFPANSCFQPSPNNIPQVGDVGWWNGHMMIFDSDAGMTKKGEVANGWSATNPNGQPFGTARHEWFDTHYGTTVKWFRYTKKKQR